MTVSSTTVKNSFSGDGSTTQFTYTFPINTTAELKVIERSSLGAETVKTLNSDYTVVDNGSSGGTVTFTSAPVSGTSIVLLRDTNLTQDTDYVANDPFPAESHETALDKLTLQQQEIQEEIDRSLKLSRTNTMTSTEFTIDASSRANKVLGFDSAGELSVTTTIGSNRGNWASGTAYSVRDIVKDTSTNNIFMVNAAHTSSGAEPLTTNTNSTKYDLLVDVASTTASQNAAASSASAAATSETNSAASAASALSHKNDAETAKTAAETAQTASETARSAAQTAQAAAETALDTFDDRFLGAKSSDPSVDNDGAALTDGALYFDTTNDIMKVYDLTNTQWRQLTLTSGNQNNVNTVATNISDVNAIANEITPTNNIQTLVTNISDIQTLAGISNLDVLGTNATSVVNAGNNITGLNSFAQKYQVSANQPSSSNEGDLWYDTTNDRLKIYTGNTFNLASDFLENLINEYTYNISSTVNSVSGSDANSRTFSYTVDSQVNVFLNGVRLVPTSDYSLSNGDTITFTSNLQNNDVVFIQVFTKLTVAQEAQLDAKVTTAQQAVTDAQSAQTASESARDLSQQYRDSSQTFSNNSSASATASANSATDSANSATASSNSATASANSATSAQNNLDTFNDKFISSATAPSNPSDGDLWYDTVNVRLKIYINGRGWQNAGAYLEGLISNFTYTATSGQTAFSVDDDSVTLSFTADANVFVFLNGVRLTPTDDYVLSGGNTCTLTTGATAGDTLYIEVITKISLTQETTLQGYVSTALGYKNDAETAKTASQTAQTASENAKTASESARDLAQSYRDTASTHTTTATTQAGIATSKTTECSNSADDAEKWANNAHNLQFTLSDGVTTGYSAKHYAEEASASATQAQQFAGGGAETAKITSNDTTAGNLDAKIVAGDGLTKTILNSGGDEDLELKLSMTETSATPTSGQTTFSVNYTVGYIQVFLNGIKLINGTDFTATNGTSVVLTSGATTTSDVIEFVVWA